MTDTDQQRRIHDLEATLRVGKGGVDSVADELASQLETSDLVKVKFLRSARGGTTSEQLAEELAERTNAEVVQTRGHTAVFQR
ncbi:YhbY family RNA-binding protein [Halapricum desulfuricans]|uniref:RNA-binding protein containing KH domain n=1 Tax=Halapricum desulfuricans TaxID=2841257 RepID=A0A897NP91_9EURY|nr:YhbY family RNA-binding protein [Halapricum desulfuricans]QSG08169.1 RNA-binding protein containing KH domain [Halapricum desulfuricans]QSG12703.1 RNA-binding protein containing KH domain [Halapricum desulfuricans]